MNTKKTQSLHSVQLFAFATALSMQFISSPKALAACTNTLLKFTEYSGTSTKAPSEPPGELKGRQISAYLRCDGDIVNVPQVTTMHFIESKNGQTCYHDRACGNVKSWGVYIGISGVWDWFKSSTEFFEGPAFNQYEHQMEKRCCSSRFGCRIWTN
jgi:hypothetical protein